MKAHERGVYVAFFGAVGLAARVLTDHSDAAFEPSYPLAVSGVALFAWRLSPASMLVMLGFLGASWTLSQPHVRIDLALPGALTTAAVEVDGFLHRDHVLNYRLYGVDGGFVSPRGDTSSRRYYLKGASGLCHRELLSARFDGGDPRRVAASADGSVRKRDSFVVEVFGRAPAHGVALPSTCWFNQTRIGWVLGDRPATVHAGMTVQDFAAANPGHHVLMTVELSKR